MTGSEGAAGADGAAPLVNILGERVALGPLRRDLMPHYLRWVNDFGLAHNFGQVRPLTEEQERAWYDRQVAAEHTATFTVYERATWRPIGTANLNTIDHRNGTATYGVGIGEGDCRGKGYGTEVTRLMLDYAFTAVGLHSVMLIAFAYNRAGLRAYARAGFRECGRRREAYRLAGRRWDIVYMECLATDFTSPVLGALLAPDAPQAAAGGGADDRG